MQPKKTTGWGKVAQWYHDTVEDKGSYQKDLILPNLLRLMDVKKGERVLDLACGEGFFSRRLAKLGAKVIGVDIAPELIAIASSFSKGGWSRSDGGFEIPPRSAVLPFTKGEVEFHVASADKIPFVKDNSVDKVAIILAVQNIENIKGTLAEVNRVLKPGGKLYLVLNHPAFRVPKESSWGYDPVRSNDRQGSASNGASEQGIQYRRIDRYMSESRTKIQMYPGDKPDEMTITLHRPLQFYFKQLGKAGFGVTNMEEWVSEKESQKGPRQEAENRARKEIPLFLCLEAQKF